MKILISGAGIAGLTLAFWLRRLGHNVTMLERSPSLRGEGYMIDFFASGYDVAEKMEILEDLAKIHYPIAKFSFVDEAGREKFNVPYPALRKLFDDRHFNFMRGDLERVLHSKLDGKVPIRFGTTLTDLQFEADQVCANLSDGSTDKYDLIIGADGIHSKVRQLVFGEEQRFKRFLGYYVIAFIIDRPAESFRLGDAFYTLTVPGKQAGVYPIRNDRVATAFIFAGQEGRKDFSPGAAQKELRRVYGDFGWIVPELLQAAEGADIYFDEVSQIEMPTWKHHNVVLIGDACQCVSLAAGQGASLAMAGAFILSQKMFQHELNLESALVEYQRRMKPVVEQKQLAGRRIAKWFVPNTRFRILIRDAIMRFAATKPGRTFLKRFLDTGSLFPRRETLSAASSREVGKQ